MTEQDKQMQMLIRTNLALLGELQQLKDCSTCIHGDEKISHCESSIGGYYCPDKDGYEWRGVEAYCEWRNGQITQERLEKEAERLEQEFEKFFGGEYGSEDDR